MDPSEVPEVRVLNGGDISASQPARSGLDLSKDLQKLMLRIKGSFMSDDGRGINYTALRESKLFEEYQSLSRDLQRTVINGFSVDEKMAFFLSILFLLELY